MLAHHYLEALRLTRVSGRAVPSSLTDKARLAARDAGDRALALAAFAIALGLRPEILLLDEPAAGVPSAESHIILDAIDSLPREIGVLIIDHDMDLVFRFA